MSTTTVTPEVTPIPALPTVPAEVQRKVNILDNAMLLTIIRQWPPQTKAISNAVVNTTATPGWVTVSKKLFKSKEFSAIVNNETVLDNFIKRRSSPMPFRSGNHLVAMDLFNEVEAEFNKHVIKRDALINTFVAAWKKIVERAEKELGSNFHAQDYPSEQEIRSYFYFAWDWMDFKVSEKLESVNKEIAARKSTQMAREVRHAAEVGKQLMRAEMQEIVTHLTERLSSKEENGELKRKTFRDTLLDRITDFKTVFDPRNIAGDSELKTLVDQTEALLKGVDPIILRSDDALRNSVHDGFAKIKDELGKMIINKPARAIQLEE